jgi:hypothetical protein
MRSTRGARTNRPRLPRSSAGNTLKAQHDAFVSIAAAQDPLDLPRLHALVPTMRSAEGAKEMELLIAWPDDPRHTTFFLGMIQRPPYMGTRTAKVWRRIFQLFEKQGDPRVLEG